MDWSYDGLWNKTKLFVERALSERRTSALFPFWATIALEFLGRATLAKVHPSLLADPQSGDNILYACGHGNVKNPRSVPAKTVFLRCQSVVTDFTGQDFAFVMSLMDKRNEELHSGGLPYEDFPTELWLADYFRVCNLLLDFQDLSLEELFGEEEGKIAQQMIEAATESRKSEILKRIAAHKTIFESWEAEEQKKKIEAAAIRLSTISQPHRVAECPSCGSRCVITGEIVRTTDPRLENELLTWDVIVLPRNLTCYVCDLELKGHQSLHITQLGGQFTIVETVDPHEYYEAAFDPAEYYGQDYSNE